MAATKVEFEKVVNQYSSRVLNTAAKVLGDTQSAQDVHQEVFLSIWKRWHKYNGQTNWPAYLYRATIRKALNLAKKKRGFSLQSCDMEFAAQTKPPDSDIRADELQQKLFHLVSALPQRQADAFVLSRIEGLEYHEIAKMMSCSVETVRVHVHRALKSLANNLADYFPKRTVD